MLVEEIMKRDVVTASPEESVETVARRLMEHGISGLPVVEADGKVVGMLTEGDLLRQAKRVQVPGALEMFGGIIFLENTERFYEELRRMVAINAGNLMTKKVITATPRTTVEEAATLMVERSINRLPVVDDQGKLTGIITRQDLVQSMYMQG